MKNKRIFAFLMFALLFLSVLVIATPGVTPTRASPTPAPFANISATSGAFYINITGNESFVQPPNLTVYNISGGGARAEYAMSRNGTDAAENYAFFNVTGLTNGTYEWVVTFNTSSLGANQTFGGFNVTLGEYIATTITSPANGTGTADFTPEIRISANTTFVSNLSLTIYTNKDGALQAVINDTIANATERSINVTALTNGTYIIIAELGSDLKQNTTALTIYIDTVMLGPDTIVITSPVNGTNTSDSTPEIKISVNDTIDANLSITIYAINLTGGGVVQAIINDTIANATERTINLTSLTNNSYDIIVEATDDSNSKVNSTARRIHIDLVAPTVSISVSKSSITVTESITVTCSYSDSFTGINTTTVVIDRPSNPDQAINCGDSYTPNDGFGNYVASITATDLAGNSATATAVFEVSSGSSGGGSGGGGSATAGGKSQLFVQVTPGAASIMKINDATYGVKQIIIEVNNQATNVRITVTKLSGQPAEVTQITGTVYQWLNITKENLNNNNIKSAKIRFNVTKSWISSNGFTDNQIVLKRFVSSWESLPTLKVGESSTDVEYEATTPGFSVFAITGEQPAPQAVCGNGVCDTNESAATCPADCAAPSEESQPQEPQQTSEQSEAAEQGEANYTYVGILAVLIVIAGAYFVIKRQKKQYSYRQKSS